MGNNNWKITCLHYGTLSCYKSLFDGGLDQVRYPFVYSGYLLQKGNRNILVDTGVHQDNIIDGKAWANSPAEGGNQYVLDALAREGLTPDDIEIVMYTHLHCKGPRPHVGRHGDSGANGRGQVCHHG